MVILSDWVRTYRKFGLEGLKRKDKKTTYSVQLKVYVLHFMKQTVASYSDTAIIFGMNYLSLITNWNRSFQEKRIEGLKLQPKGRPSMTKKPKKQQKSDSSSDRSRKEMEREIELLRLENAYLKKKDLN